MDQAVPNEAALKRRLEREKRARQAAEKLLEEKASELYEANQKLAETAQELEDLLQGKTLEANRATEGLIAAETRLWEAISVLPGGFAIYDGDYDLVIANQNYGMAMSDPETFLRRGTPRAKILDHILFSTRKGLTSHDREEAIAAERERWEQGDFRTFELETETGMWLRVTEQKTASGDCLHYYEDITQERLKNEELRAAKYDAEAASRAKSAFLANMSHEIRTPMNGVIGMADLLCDTDMEADQKLYAQTIRNSGEALLVILNDILDYSKIEAGQMELFPSEFDLEETVFEAITLLQSRARDKGLDLLLDYDLHLPVRFICDAGRLRQVLLNLIGNAIKFTEEGYVLVRVVGLQLDGGKYDVRIAVEDTGIGIPKDKLTSIFEEFKQADQVSTRRHEGTGLGLAIAKRLVNLMGGQVWADSVQGEGSVFGVGLTLDEAPGNMSDFDFSTLSASGLARALLVDDIAQNRIILEKQISQVGIETVCTDSVEAALEIFKTDSAFDLIVTDFYMPGANGTELARQLRGQGYTGRMVCLTSAASLGLKQPDHNLFDEVLQKPALRRDIYRSLGVMLGTQTRSDAVAASDEAESVLANGEIDLLVAEDNRTNLLVLRRMLDGQGCRLRTAEDGLVLLAEYARKRPDAIITDISMPEMDGSEAIRRIRAEEKALGLDPLPIVVLTAHAMAGDADGFLAAGATGYLSKPVKKSALIEQLNTMKEQIRTAETMNSL
ncbi:MAG: response regulator [Pseudomonadota bacterium]